MGNNTNNVWRLLWTLIHQWFYATVIRFYMIHLIFIFRNNKNKDNDKTNGHKSKSNISFIKTVFLVDSKECLENQ